MWSTFHAKMDRCQFLPLPLQRLFVTREKAPVREGKERMVNLLFQETSNLSLQANVTSQKPVLRKTGDSELFLASAYPRLLFLFFAPLPLFFTSIHPFAEKGSSHCWNTPVHTGITRASWFISKALCVLKCLWMRAKEMVWFTLTDRFCNTVLQIIFPLHQPARATYS